MKYFDSHAHYYDERFYEELPLGPDALLNELFSNNISYIINVGTRYETSRLAIEQAGRFPGMYTAIGIHPTDIRFIDYDMERAVSEISSLARDPASKCVAIGEIGLDYHYPDTDVAAQKRYFRRQMRLAEELGLPVVIHDRDAHGDIMEIIREYPAVRGVLHSFSGSAEMAEELVGLGYMISFSGTLTFTNARKPREVAARVARDRILIETDAPYLAPHPKRGTLNHSGNLEYTAGALAEILDISAEEAALLTEKNAKEFFGIK